MKPLLSLPALLIMSLLSACGQDASQTTENQPTQSEPNPQQPGDAQEQAGEGGELTGQQGA